MPHATPQPSCYLLEYSVSPGGVRLGEVYAHGTFAGLKELVSRRCGIPTAFDPYLVLSYGAVLTLLVVQSGEITESIDLHPLLRTGTPALDATLHRLVDLRDTPAAENEEDLWPHAEEILEANGDDPIATLPLFSQIFELRDRIAATPDATTAARARSELAELIEEAKDAEPSELDEPATDAPTLDWAALEAVTPPLEGPILEAGGVAVSWSADAVRDPGSYIAASRKVRLHAGFNDLEFGDDVYLYESDED